MDKIGLLKKCQFFSELSDVALSTLSHVVRSNRRNRGELLFSEGDEACALYILASGSVDLVKISPDGREQFVRGVKSGEMFAEAAMFSGDAYPVTAIVRSNSELLSINKNDFMALVKKHPEVSLQIMGVMARLLRHLNTLLSDLSLGTVVQRLANFLLKKSKEKKSLKFELDIPKKELAFKLGTIPETLSRNFRKLEKDGAISVKSNLIIIKNIDELEDIAGK